MGKSIHWTENMTDIINSVIYENMEKCDRAQTQKNFASTRQKLQLILKRHEKIKTILEDAKQRLVPIQFLLMAFDMKNFVEKDVIENPYSFTQSSLTWPYSELKELRVNKLKKIEKQPIDPEGDWRKTLKNLNDWLMEMDSKKTVSLTMET